MDLVLVNLRRLKQRPVGQVGDLGGCIDGHVRLDADAVEVDGGGGDPRHPVADAPDVRGGGGVLGAGEVVVDGAEHVILVHLVAHLLDDLGGEVVGDGTVVPVAEPFAFTAWRRH